MGLFSRFSKPKFDDTKIVSLAMRAIEEDPLCHAPGQVLVTSKDGVITITGTADTEREKAHLEGAARSAIKMAGVKFTEIVNQIVVGR